MSIKGLETDTLSVCTLSDKQLLQDLLNSNIMNSDVVRQQLNMIKQNKVLEIHEYTITTPKDTDSRWQTYVKKNEKRVKISAVNEQGLYDKLYDFYFQQNLSLEMLHPEWVEKRTNTNVSIRSIRRYKNYWDRYYKNHKVVKVPITTITTDMLETFFNEKIKEHSLTLKELNNMKFILKDMLKLCKRKKLISENPFNDIEINKHACRPANTSNDISRVYLPVEQQHFFQALRNEILTFSNNTDCYAISLLFKLGLRIGELCALTWDDIDLETSEIHIHRMETLGEDSNGKTCPVVVPYTKKKSSFGDRFLPLSEYELDLFQKVKTINEEYNFKDGNFIFCDENGRTKIREIDNRIRKLCKQANIIPAKSAHDIRRTVATQMHMQGVPIQIIKEFLGHSDTKTTWGYIVNNQEKEVVHIQIKEALANLNGLGRTQVS